MARTSRKVPVDARGLPWNPDHRDCSAYTLQFANGAIAGGCHHHGCQGRKWRDLRALFDDRTKSTKSTNAHANDAGEDSSNSSNPYARERPWPVLHTDALYGLAGEIVRAIEPATSRTRSSSVRVG